MQPYFYCSASHSRIEQIQGNLYRAHLSYLTEAVQGHETAITFKASKPNAALIWICKRLNNAGPDKWRGELAIIKLNNSTIPIN